MIIVNGLLAGTFAVAGVRIAFRRRRRNLMYWLAIADENPFETQDRQALTDIDQRVDTSYRLSSISLGLSLLGVLFYAPLGWASVPITLVAALPLFERTLDNAIDRFEINSDVFGTTILSLCLIVENFFLASLLQWLYAVNEKAAFQFSERMQRFYDPNSEQFDWAALWDAAQQARWRFNGDIITLDETQFASADAAPKE